MLELNVLKKFGEKKMFKQTDCPIWKYPHAHGWLYVLVSHAALLTFLACLDGYFVQHAYYSTLLKGASVQLVFGFEVCTCVFELKINCFCPNNTGRKQSCIQSW